MSKLQTNTHRPEPDANGEEAVIEVMERITLDGPAPLPPLFRHVFPLSGDVTEWKVWQSNMFMNDAKSRHKRRYAKLRAQKFQTPHPGQPYPPGRVSLEHRLRQVRSRLKKSYLWIEEFP